MFALARPLVVLDLETTGTHVEVDRIVQIGLVKVYPDGRRSEWQTLVNPGILIPPEATSVHGIDDERVRDAPSFHALCPQLVKGLRGCDVGGYNVQFDLRFLKAELQRCDVPLEAGLLDGAVLDAYMIFMLREPRHLTAAVQLYCGEELAGAHDALTDARAALRVLEAQLERYPDLPQSANELHDLLFNQVNEHRVDPDGKFYWRHGEACFGFGKYPGRPLREIAATDPRYLRWIIGASFSPAVKELARRALAGQFPRREG